MENGTHDRKTGWGPAAALLLAAPLIAEVLPGWTRASALFVLPTEIGTWGCGALLLRAMAVRWKAGWPSLLLLGLALALAEECLIQQTSLAPMTGLARREYGRALGVNWVYLIWALGFESVWVLVLPARLVELLYPARRRQTWIGAKGAAAAALAFLLAAVVASASWTQYARTQVFHMPPYQPPPADLLAAAGAIAALVASAWLLRGLGRAKTRSPARRAPSPWRVGLAAFGLALPLCALVLPAYGATPQLPWSIAAGAAVLWGGLTLGLVARWSRAAGWDDPHRLALVLAGVAASMAAGALVFAFGGASPLDWGFKAVADGLALGLLGGLGRKVAKRARCAQRPAA